MLLCCPFRSFLGALTLLTAAVAILSGCVRNHVSEAQERRAPIAAAPPRADATAPLVPQFADAAAAMGIHFVRDHGGDLDILLVPIEGPVALLMNEGGNRGNWLQFRLRGRQSNRDGIGARIDVTVEGRTLRDEVRSAYSYCSANDPRAHFGLGAALKASNVRIRWPSGHTDVFTDVAANGIYLVTERQGIRPWRNQ